MAAAARLASTVRPQLRRSCALAQTDYWPLTTGHCSLLRRMPAPLYNLRAFQLALIVARLTPRAFGQFLAPFVARSVARRNPAARDAIRENLRQSTGLTGAAL